MPTHLEFTRSKPTNTHRQIPQTAGRNHIVPSLKLTLIGLLALLPWAPAHAQSLIPAPTEGIYISTEQSTLHADTLASALPDIERQDPALLLLQDAASPKTDLRNALWFDDDAWITELGTLLYNDEDRDGYHSSISLTIDADTVSNYMEVYVTIDLQRIPGTRERLHTSDNFSIYQSSLSDEYQIDFDLLQNYPAGFYNLFIELHDAYDQSVLDRVSATDFSNLSRLPLESEDLDYVYDPAPYEPQHPPANDDVYATEYAGSAGFLTILCLTLVLGVRRGMRN
ncbi:choice-of-anchor H family protein [Granulosicoccus antarcticus]|uniref:Uncharacterized protein n=1 Tax=Granulosicoccus antarcticus IMCC3135 TaxID=1192854 RepID=A0A2Z2P1G5_9GAMM|nr:choice-of-anchor H family protein [Granulosicoccus antarcticus]ASJ75080.1 hypothetical protein IMCC3135_25085 [Granulosicoccus antarcticus IMCC3135]